MRGSAPAAWARCTPRTTRSSIDRLHERYPVKGRAAVLEFFGKLGPNLGQARLVDSYVNDALDAICAEAEVDVRQPPCTLRVIDRFVVNAAGRIVDQENHYDPRPALQPAKRAEGL